MTVWHIPGYIVSHLAPPGSKHARLLGFGKSYLFLDPIKLWAKTHVGIVQLRHGMAYSKQQRLRCILRHHAGKVVLLSEKNSIRTPIYELCCYVQQHYCCGCAICCGISCVKRTRTHTQTHTQTHTHTHTHTHTRAHISIFCFGDVSWPWP